MIDPDRIAEQVKDWCLATLPVLVGSYAYGPMGKDQGLPDVAVEVERINVTFDPEPRLPQAHIQQAALAVYEVSASFVSDIGNSEAEAHAAAQQLRGFARDAATALHADTTLGGRVQFGSPVVLINFVPQFVRYEDGTRGRAMTMHLVIGELLGE